MARAQTTVKALSGQTIEHKAMGDKHKAMGDAGNARLQKRRQSRNQACQASKLTQAAALLHNMYLDIGAEGDLLEKPLELAQDIDAIGENGPEANFMQDAEERKQEIMQLFVYLLSKS